MHHARFAANNIRQREPRKFGGRITSVSKRESERASSAFSETNRVPKIGAPSTCGVDEICAAQNFGSTYSNARARALLSPTVRKVQQSRRRNESEGLLRGGPAVPIIKRINQGLHGGSGRFLISAREKVFFPARLLLRCMARRRMNGRMRPNLHSKACVKYWIVLWIGPIVAFKLAYVMSVFVIRGAWN